MHKTAAMIASHQRKDILGTIFNTAHNRKQLLQDGLSPTAAAAAASAHDVAP